MSFGWLIALVLFTISDASHISSTTPRPSNETCDAACKSSEYVSCYDTTNSTNKSVDERNSTSDLPGAACGLIMDLGSGNNFTVKWYYDNSYGICTRFWYGGCEGNGNRFNTREDCENICVSPKGRDVCYLTSSSGPCQGYYPQWFYESSVKRCYQFVYGGCLGNNNKFETLAACETLCLSPNNTEINEEDIAARTVSRDPCDDVRAECNIIHCVHNIETYIDEQGCENCRCVNPCGSVTCPHNTRCTMTLSTSALGGVRIVGICRSTTKAGRCPVVSNNMRCEQECTNDNDCSRDWKCCSNGCGTSCLEPVLKQPVYTPHGV